MKVCFFAAAALSLASCAEPIVPRQETFRESDFVHARGRGSATITGRAFVTMRDNSEHVAAGEKVELVPVTPYTTEIIQVEFVRSRDLPSSDPRIDKYIRTTQTDEDGRFAFRGVPPGEYYIDSNAEWTHWFWGGTDGTDKVTMHDTCPISARVSIKNGQSVDISDWTFGRVISK